MGQEIEILVDGEVHADVHEFRWSPKNLASGVYLCRMSCLSADRQAGAFVDARKLMYKKIKVQLLHG